jgi:hypothetical protein
MEFSIKFAMGVDSYLWETHAILNETPFLNGIFFFSVYIIEFFLSFFLSDLKSLSLSTHW